MTPELRQQLARSYADRLLLVNGYHVPEHRARDARKQLLPRSLREIGQHLFEGEHPGWDHERIRQEVYGWMLRLGSVFNDTLLVFLSDAIDAEFRQLTATASWCRRRTLQRFSEKSYEVVCQNPDAVELGTGSSGEPDTLVVTEDDITRTIRNKTWRLVIPRPMLVGLDDVTKLGELAKQVAERAATAFDDILWGDLTSNSGVGPTLDDGTALFNSTRSNLLTGSNTALSSSSFAAACEALRNLTDSSGVRRKQVARFLITPASLEVTALSILKSLGLNASITQSDALAYQRTPRGTVYPGAVTLITEPYLDTVNDAAWYVATAQQLQGYELLLLDQPELALKIAPVTRSELMALVYIVNMDAGVKVTSGTGLVRCAGA